MDPVEQKTEFPNISFHFTTEVQSQSSSWNEKYLSLTATGPLGNLSISDVAYLQHKRKVTSTYRNLANFYDFNVSSAW